MPPYPPSPDSPFVSAWRCSLASLCSVTSGSAEWPTPHQLKFVNLVPMNSTLVLPSYSSIRTLQRSMTTTSMALKTNFLLLFPELNFVSSERQGGGSTQSSPTGNDGNLPFAGAAPPPPSHPGEDVKSLMRRITMETRELLSKWQEPFK